MTMEKYAKLVSSVDIASQILEQLETDLANLKAKRADFLAKVGVDTIVEARTKIDYLKSRIEESTNSIYEEATSAGILGDEEAFTLAD